MDLLDKYLMNEYLDDKRRLTAIEQVVEEACTTLIETFDEEEGWPYDVKSGLPKKSQTKKKPSSDDDFSYSTAAMVSLALIKCLENKRPYCLSFKPPKLSKKLKAEIEGCTDPAIRLLNNKISKKKGTESSSFGENDPLTAVFVAELECSIKEAEGSVEKLDNYFDERRKKYIELNKKDQIREAEKFFNYSSSDENKKETDSPTDENKKKGVHTEEKDVHTNAFIPLKAVQFVRYRETHNQKTNKNIDLNNYHNFFETTLHDQLSFSSIPDSRFDPAELAFCLEGLLLTRADTVDEVLFKRVLEVFGEAEGRGAFWRATKPFLATKQGFILSPISVEVVNSLLRSCEMFDGDNLHGNCTALCMGLFRRYWQWLKARKVCVPKGKVKLFGWHSDHVNKEGLIHTWETSQVLEFLLGYHRLLQAHIARTCLVQSRFDVREPKSGLKGKWNKIKTDYEPVKYLGEHYKIYNLIGTDFIDDGRNNPNYYSMLLYGPPGTGKTTVAENIADALGQRLITITVSDFLAAGDAQLEARAKTIFEVLKAQCNCVVLFDEIDNFLLDRDSKRYSEQSTAFQFMTPGMLTKLADLRKSERVLFIIATNYEYRIDAAIKRSGRIDKKYLVLPPDAAGRVRIMKRLLNKDSKSRWKDHYQNRGPELKRKSIYLGYKDIEGAISDLKNLDEGPDALVANLQKRVPSTTVESYENKIDGDKVDPVEEICALAGLGLQNKVVDFGDDRFNIIKTKLQNIVSKNIQKNAHLSNFPDAVKNKIKNALELADGGGDNNGSKSKP